MTIDVHGHVTSPELFKRFPMPPSLADIDGMIEQKLAVGIDMTIVGSPVGAGTMVPVPGLDNYAQPADQLDAFHEWVAETVRSHRDNLRGYVYVNPFAEDGSLAGAAKLLGREEFVGLIVNTSVRGEYLGSPRAEEFFAMAEETGSPVLLHPPAEPVGAAAMNGHLGLVEHVARPCDITCGVASILFAGWLDKFPRLKLIAANAGGALSLLREKLDLAQQRARGGPPPGAGGPPRGGPPAGGPPAEAVAPMSGQLSRIYVDTATPSRLALSAAATVFGPERLLFGTDSPPLTAPLHTGLDLVEELAVSAEQRELIRSGTARELFGLETS
ncbi:amidohydrolase family protein [Amycolatopsis nigrescens]|uniref:amidohydrolase family protein n=1 Tax=Amycolatopsis nigrescens TaxID=381445 RepID=UPI00037438D2|nr:amidohydrolase family protein [Amycolatopsis nigrescens]